eukprot:CAMPEP_0206385376 /NCGR_PEP_ID=MMETSP0294-20121207/15225_1 /ASSEMBLY_ACC=CAM_ASM_000327 /TAXON_ID=39354 /ORGANISM="Heterosigma akashiwo, Strain CCMP2393" /LENGTH=181 /DNA_ID=CAMNT_0053836049 /DNA_START=113 /DNA_END=654 /DNA_ORIENTATION=+
MDLSPDDTKKTAQEVLGYTPSDEFNERVMVKFGSITPAPTLPAENDDGDTEYKLKLVGVVPERFMHLKTQLNFRLNEGNNHCTYQLGYQDGGFPQGLNKEELVTSLQTLDHMAQLNEARILECSIMQGSKGLVAEVQLMRCALSRPGSMDLTSSGDGGGGAGGRRGRGGPGGPARGGGGRG